MVIICPRCSAPNGAKAKFCHKCGAVLGGHQDLVEETRPVGQEAPAAPQAKVASPPSVDPETSCPQAPAPTSLQEETEAFAGSQEPSGSVSGDTRILEAATAELETVIEAGVGVIPTEEDCLPVPVAVAVSFERVLVSGCQAVFQCRLVNRSGEPLREASVQFESEAFSKRVRLRLPPVPPGRQIQRPIEVQVRSDRAGHSLLRCTLEFGSGDQRYSYIGLRSLDILSRPADISNVSVNIGDILSNRDGGVGDNENAVVNNLVDLSKIQTLNDLLALTLPECFSPLRLEMDYEVSYRTIATKENVEAQGVRLVSPGVRDELPSATVLRLEPLTGDPAAALTLVSRPVFRLGRSRSDADLVTWFWPRSESNDARTKRLSRIHALCEITGGVLTLRDGGSSTGTRYEGAKVGTDAVPLRDRGQLDLGGDFSLAITCFPSDFDPSLDLSNSADWAGPTIEPLAVRGAVRFGPPHGKGITPSPTLPPWQALWLLSDATFGTSHANPLPLEDPQLSEIQGRFIHWQGRFWLQALSRNSAISVDGNILAPGTLQPLTEGQRLTLGSRVFAVHPLA